MGRRVCVCVHVFRRCADTLSCNSAATINFALDSWLGYLIGVLTVLNAFFNFYVIKFHKGFHASGLNMTSDPNASYSGGEEEMRKFIIANPKLAQKALSAGTNFAKENPQLAA